MFKYQFKDKETAIGYIQATMSDDSYWSEFKADILKKLDALDLGDCLPCDTGCAWNTPGHWVVVVEGEHRDTNTKDISWNLRKIAVGGAYVIDDLPPIKTKD